jgi:sacsin
VPVNLLLVKNTTMHGVFWGSYMQHSYAQLADGMAEVLQWLADGKLSLQVSHRCGCVRASFKGGRELSSSGLTTKRPDAPAHTHTRTRTHTHRYPLERVPEAMQALAQRQVRGKVIITMGLEPAAGPAGGEQQQQQGAAGGGDGSSGGVGPPPHARL